MSDRLIIIRNWEKFQHKDVWKKSGGRPPWIKTYTALLHDDNYLGLTHAQRGILQGLWLLRASSGLDPNETTSRRLLCTNKGESRHFLSNLEALNRAGYIEFLSQPTRESVASKVRLEEKRVDIQDQRTTSDVEAANGSIPLDEPYFEVDMSELVRGF
jgi:hypothetical protein